MYKTTQTKLTKQIDRYNIAVLTVSGREVIRADVFLRKCLLNLAKSEKILKIEYYKNK